MVYFHSIRAAVMALAVCFVVLAFVLCIASALRLPVANPYVHKALNVVRNENFDKLQGGYLFPEIGRRRNAYLAENPDAKLVESRHRRQCTCRATQRTTFPPISHCLMPMPTSSARQNNPTDPKPALH